MQDPEALIGVRLIGKNILALHQKLSNDAIPLVDQRHAMIRLGTLHEAGDDMW